MKSTRRAPDTEVTVEKPLFWAKTWTETRKRGTGAKSAGRREKYQPGARHGGYCGKTSILGENVGRNAKTWNRGEVGRTSGKVPDGRPTRRIRWKNQYSGRKRGPKRENVEPGRSRPDVVKSTRRAPDTEDTVEKPVFWSKTWAETRKRGTVYVQEILPRQRNWPFSCRGSSVPLLHKLKGRVPRGG